MSKTIDHTTLSALISAGAVTSIEVIGSAGGWGVIAKFGKAESTLVVKRGTVRTFRKFETLVNYLRDLGVVEYKVNALNFCPTNLQKVARPDASARLKDAHNAKKKIEVAEEKTIKPTAGQMQLLV